MTLPLAGWYPDPASQDNIRFWDGQAWTDRVQPRSMPVPPPPPPPPASSPVAPYGYQPAPYQPAQQPQMLDPWGSYAPAPQVPSTARLGPDGQVLAGWWRRAGGYFIDSIIVTVPAAIAAAIAMVVITSNGGSLINDEAWDDVAAQFEAGITPSNADVMSIFASGFWTVTIVAGVVWFVASMINGVYLVSTSGQTVGDRAVNTRKVMAGRTVPTLGTALARWLVPNVLFGAVSNVVPLGFLISWFNYLWAAWDGKSQTLHDKMVRTYVERADLVGSPNSRPPRR